MTKNSLRVGMAAAAAIAGSAATASATPLFSTTPTLIPLTADAANVQPGGALTSFDISTYDPATNVFYLGDRSNAGISAWNLNTNTFIGTIGGGQFTGQTGNNATSGADGTAAFTTTGANPVHLVLGGDGNSTVKAYTVTGNGTSLANYSSTPTYTVNTGLPGIPATSPINNTPPGIPVVGSGVNPGNNRADEMAYDPTHNNVLVANNAASPTPFTTLFDASTGAIISQVIFDGTNGTPNAVGNSIEASTYDPAKDVFWLAIPQIGPSASDPGGLSEVNATTGAVIATFSFAGAANANGCSPTGVAISGNSVAIGCSNRSSQTLIFNTDTHTFTSLPSFSGTDAVVYDPAINAFLLSGAGNVVNGVLTPSFAIIDASTNTISQVIPTSPGNDHSVDGGNGIIGVPFTGGPTSVCPNGCLAVYTEVPEPGTLPIFATALAGLVGFAVRRRLS